MAESFDNETGNRGREEREFESAVGSREKRILKARRGEDRGALFWVGMFGLVGWSVALPTLAGICAGICMDRRWPSHVSWTLTMMFVGLVLGCLTAWHWVRRESRGNKK